MERIFRVVCFWSLNASGVPVGAGELEGTKIYQRFYLRQNVPRDVSDPDKFRRF